jgi:hypothetical protein
VCCGQGLETLLSQIEAVVLDWKRRHRSEAEVCYEGRSVWL